jgi:hypothetical protein
MPRQSTHLPQERRVKKASAKEQCKRTRWALLALRDVFLRTAAAFDELSRTLAAADSATPTLSEDAQRVVAKARSEAAVIGAKIQHIKERLDRADVLVESNHAHDALNTVLAAFEVPAAEAEALRRTITEQ